MKTFLLTTTLALSVLIGNGFALEYQTTNSGDWTASTTWELIPNTGSGVPTSSDFTIINNDKTVTVSSGDAATVGVLGIGSSETSTNNTVAGSGTLNITGGSLTITGSSSTNSAVGRTGNVSNSLGTLNLSGGVLQFTTTTNSYALYIGGANNTTGAYTNNSSIATFSGGTYGGGLVIGSTNSIYGTGILYIQGNGATIGSQFSGQSLTINNGGTLDFVLSSSGAVSTLNYGSNAVTLAGSSTIDIDPSAYSGGSETLNLIDFNTLSGTPNLTLIGSDASNYSLSTVSTTGNVVSVTLNAVPEPSTWALFGIGMLAFGWRLRRQTV
jgi:hypothetical protein